MAAVAGEAHSVSRTVPLSSPDEFATRPNFISKHKLAALYSCTLCEEILLQPQQAACGHRVCKVCIDKAFGDKEGIPCPFSHDEYDDEDDDEEPCQQEGLRRSDVCNDRYVQHFLRKQKCYCPNQPFGCTTTEPWKLLSEHVQSCEFIPELCRNTGCPEKVAIRSKLSHQEECLYVITSCCLCKEIMARKDLKEHIKQCERSCKTCPKVFDHADKLLVHQRIHEPCITEAGKCFYYHYCMFEATSVEQLKTHMKDEVSLHLEAVVNNLLENNEHVKENIQKEVNAKMKPLEKVTAETMRSLTDRQESSEKNEGSLVNAMRTVAHSSQQIEQVASKVAVIERQINDSGLDGVNVIELHSWQLRRHAYNFTDMETRMMNPEYVSYDGTLLWHIDNYQRSKINANTGELRSIDSKIFYSSGCGYKMRCRGYLNGDGLGTGQYLSLYLVVMKGEFDIWLQFPFKQKVTFSLLCPSNHSLSITQTFEPDGIGPYPANPLAGINISPGCPRFALQSQVESRNFLDSDSIWIKVVVAPGGDEIP